MSYKVNKEDVDHENDQHLNIKDDLDFSTKDIFALCVAALQIILPFVLVLGLIMAIVLILFQIFF